LEKLIIATRASDLALWQAYHIQDRLKAAYPTLEIELNKITSNGDKVLDKPLALIGGKGHFTKELEDEMLAGNAHLAVHSLKDVPTFIPEGLKLSAITQRQDQSDVFLSHTYNALEELPTGAVVGTTSLRRRMQLLQLRPDLKVKDLRGNVNTRLRKLAEGQYDAIILAYIGLHRLDLLKDIPYVQKLPLENMIPPMGQAALGIEIVEGNPFLEEVSNLLNDDNTYKCTIAERDFIAAIGAGCSAPVACNATIDGKNITLTTMIGYPDGTNIVKNEMSVEISEYDKLGSVMAKDMLSKGVKEILDNAENLAFKDERPERI
jgi:hydroxymethylbilane synthase